MDIRTLVTYMVVGGVLVVEVKKKKGAFPEGLWRSGIYW